MLLRSLIIAVSLVGNGCSTTVPSTTAPKRESVSPRLFPAVLRYAPSPVYPLELKRNGVTGYAIILFDIGDDGLVSNLRVADASHPQFAEAGLAAVAKRRYEPAYERGEDGIRDVVSRDVSERIRFTIQEEQEE